jgi:RNA polymerase sigma-70 factor (sigma-E family)
MNAGESAHEPAHESAHTSVRRADVLADLYRAESAHVVNLAYLLTGQRQLAEDLAQEAFLRVASRIRQVSPDAFGAYLRQTVVNLVRSHYRHARVERRYADRVESDAARTREGIEAGSTSTDAETRDELWSALQVLPVRQREAIVCRYYLDLSEEQTADALRIAIGTVKSATSRGLQALRVTLDAERRA